MAIEPKELGRDELDQIRARATEFDAKIADTNRVDVWPACEFDRSKLLGHIAALEQEEHFVHRLNTRQTKLLTGVVNAIRGEPDELTLWSHHDAPELAQRAMRVVRAANDVLKSAAEFDIAPASISDAIQHLDDMMHAYDQLVERHEPLSAPGVELPGWQETFRKAETGAALNPIEILICRLTPGDDERATDFRRMLRAALDYTAQTVRP